jgi:hypothetical protein
VIKEAALPNVVAAAVTGGRAQGFAAAQTPSAAGDGGSYHAFQAADPQTEIKFVSTPHKEMHVIRHNHVAAESNISVNASLSIFLHCAINGLIRQNLPPARSANGHKIQWRIVSLEDAF